MHIRNSTRSALLAILLFACQCGVLLFSLSFWYMLTGIAVFVILNIFPSLKKRQTAMLRVASDGADLLTAFLIDICIQTVATIGIVLSGINLPFKLWVAILVFVLADVIVFWNGIIRVYIASPIIGLKWRVIGILCGLIPIAHIIVLGKIISLVRFDVDTEQGRSERNLARANKQVCATKYPLLLVHGVFFRDIRYFNYWGRIPNELQKNGATVYYGNQQSALSVADSGKEIAATVARIVNDTGCEKVNIIAHSKGGLDSRYAITHCGMDKYVASLTTINTPHRGCAFADWLLGKVSDNFRNSIANKYNAALRKFGDTNPDFLAAVNDLTAKNCEAFNEVTPDMPGVYYQSTGSKINKPLRNIFPLCFTSSFVKLFDGENDGLVSKKSAKWGKRFIDITTDSAEGLSHADMIDMSRHNRTDFDVCEFYVDLVSNLKNMGL